MKIIRSLIFYKKTKDNRTISKKLKIKYDTLLNIQPLELITYENNTIKKTITKKNYSLINIEKFIYNKINEGYQIYKTPKEKEYKIEDIKKELKTPKKLSSKNKLYLISNSKPSQKNNKNKE